MNKEIFTTTYISFFALLVHCYPWHEALLAPWSIKVEQRF